MIPFSMNRTQFGLTVPQLSREEKGDQQLCQKPLLYMFIALSGRELCNSSCRRIIIIIQYLASCCLGCDYMYIISRTKLKWLDSFYMIVFTVYHVHVHVHVHVFRKINVLFLKYHSLEKEAVTLISYSTIILCNHFISFHFISTFNASHMTTVT